MSVGVLRWDDLLVGDELAHLATEPTREARTAPLPDSLQPPVREALARRGIGELYAHQADAYAAAGTVLLMWAQRHVSVALSSVLVCGTAVISAAGGWLVFGQDLGALQLVGGPIVIVALSGLMLAQIPTAAPVDTGEALL